MSVCIPNLDIPTRAFGLPFRLSSWTRLSIVIEDKFRPEFSNFDEFTELCLQILLFNYPGMELISITLQKVTGDLLFWGANSLVRRSRVANPLLHSHLFLRRGFVKRNRSGRKYVFRTYNQFKSAIAFCFVSLRESIGITRHKFMSWRFEIWVDSMPD